MGSDRLKYVEEAVRTYREQMIEVTRMLAKLKMYSEHNESLSDRLQDNADTYLDADNARLRMGDLLSTLVEYWVDYTEELQSAEQKGNKASNK